MVALGLEFLHCVLIEVNKTLQFRGLWQERMRRYWQLEVKLCVPPQRVWHIRLETQLQVVFVLHVLHRPIIFVDQHLLILGEELVFLTFQLDS